MDLMIGVMAKRFGTVVLTRDVEHFQKIPGVTVLDY
jgi:predicted nucleic acid-binding protein